MMNPRYFLPAAKIAGAAAIVTALGVPVFGATALVADGDPGSSQTTTPLFPPPTATPDGHGWID